MRLGDLDEALRMIKDSKSDNPFFNGKTSPVWECANDCAISCVAACPTIDAVPVVRCKDCKHYKPPKVSAHYVNNTQYCTRVVTMKVSPDSFCSYGERKDGEG